MTEVPEHLLKRARERRAAIGGDPRQAGTGDGVERAPVAAETPATQITGDGERDTASPMAGRAPAPPRAAPPTGRVQSPVVVAANKRRRVPAWAMAALSLLPMWGFMYARALTTTAEATDGALQRGAEVYLSNCASCHGATGQGVASGAYPFVDGSSTLTFPKIEDQVRFVYFGTGAYRAAGIDVYGDPDRAGGPHLTGARGAMPQFGATAGGNLSDSDIVAVVCHERFTLGGVDPSEDTWSEEFARWCGDNAEVFEQLDSDAVDLASAHEVIEGVDVVGAEPAPPQPERDAP